MRCEFAPRKLDFLRINHGLGLSRRILLCVSLYPKVLVSQFLHFFPLPGFFGLVLTLSFVQVLFPISQVDFDYWARLSLPLFREAFA